MANFRLSWLIFITESFSRSPHVSLSPLPLDKSTPFRLAKRAELTELTRERRRNWMPRQLHHAALGLPGGKGHTIDEPLLQPSDEEMASVSEDSVPGMFA
jgi:hypothetical protein